MFCLECRVCGGALLKSGCRLGLGCKGLGLGQFCVVVFVGVVLATNRGKVCAFWNHGQEISWNVACSLSWRILHGILCPCYRTWLKYNVTIGLIACKST